MDFSGFAEPLVGRDLYEVEKALAGCSNLDCYVKRVLKVSRHEGKGLTALLRKCAKIVTSRRDERKMDKNQMVCRGTSGWL